MSAPMSSSPAPLGAPASGQQSSTKTTATILSTAYQSFLLPAEHAGHPSKRLLLRGVNMSGSAKYPTFGDVLDAPVQPYEHMSRAEREALRRRKMGVTSELGEDDGRFYSEAAEGGRNGWFVGRPIQELHADLHFPRLKSWGYNAFRWIIAWEALEHAGPYDEEFIKHTITLLRKAKSYGFKVFISPHQDVFSRFTGGSGAPYWAVEALGINPRRVHQTAASVLHCEWASQMNGGEEGIQAARDGKAGPWPDMIWNSNNDRLAPRHCATMFFASDVFAPKCKINGKPAGQYLRDCYAQAYRHLAKRLREAGGLLDECVLGWDSMNEPHAGFMQIPDLNGMPDSQSFRKGACPSPIQGFQLAAGQPVHKVEEYEFGALGAKKKGTISITPPGGDALWLTREEARDAERRWGYKWESSWDFWTEDGRGGCPWAGHGVWDPATAKVLKADYFVKKPDGGSYDFQAEFWQPQHLSYITGIREEHPQAIAFICPPVFQVPPNLPPSHTNRRLALSSHFYDAMTMLGKRRHVFNADAVGLTRGAKSLLGALKVGTSSIVNSIEAQMKELRSDGWNKESVAGETDEEAYPTLIGEMGVPFDMKEPGMMGLAKGKRHEEDYKEVAKAMDQNLTGCDRNAVSYTLWCYEPMNVHSIGDGWNGEDMSLFSYDNTEVDEDLLALAPPDLKTLMTVGARAIKSWCRPYPIATAGVITRLDFDYTSGKFELVIDVPALQADPTVRAHAGNESVEVFTEIFLPFVHYVSNAPADDQAQAKDRLLGELDTQSGLDWDRTAGTGPGRVDLKVDRLSEGRLEVVGQVVKWYYPVHASQGREIRLVIQPWKGAGWHHRA